MVASFNCGWLHGSLLNSKIATVDSFSGADLSCVAANMSIGHGDAHTNFLFTKFL